MADSMIRSCTLVSLHSLLGYVVLTPLRAFLYNGMTSLAISTWLMLLAFVVLAAYTGNTGSPLLLNTCGPCPA